MSNRGFVLLVYQIRMLPVAIMKERCVDFSQHLPWEEQTIRRNEADFRKHFVYIAI